MSAWQPGLGGVLARLTYKPHTGPLPIIGFFIVRVTYVGAEPMTVKSEKIKRDLTMAYCTYSTSQKAKKQGKFHYPSLVPSIKNCRI